MWREKSKAREWLCPQLQPSQQSRPAKRPSGPERPEAVAPPCPREACPREAFSVRTSAPRRSVHGLSGIPPVWDCGHHPTASSLLLHPYPHPFQPFFLEIFFFQES